MVRALLRAAVDLIIPPRRTEALVRALTPETLRALQDGDGTLPYREPRVQALVWEVKYFGSARAAQLAGACVGEQVLALAAEELGRPLLLPVPMHPARRRARGHNQTELLCRAALPHLRDAVEYAPHVLARTAYTPTQQGLPRAQRLANVEGSMAAQARVVAGRACVVVDDVATTGATLAEAARALRAAGAARVHCVALARSQI